MNLFPEEEDASTNGASLAHWVIAVLLQRGNTMSTTPNPATSHPEIMTGACHGHVEERAPPLPCHLNFKSIFLSPSNAGR